MAKPLGLELSEGGSSSGTSEPEAAARPEALRLDDAASASLLERLPVPEAPPAVAESGFALREASLPRPRPGRIVDVPFPPPTNPDGAPQRPAGTEGESCALGVVRYQPEGAVDVAQGVSITFSAPTIALDSVDAAVVTDPPVRLDPQPPGEWRWMDPRTLVFVAQGERMPMATAYRVEIPAGTSAANGAALAEAVTFSFKTPAPRLVERSPEGNRVRPDSLVMLVFDQPVDAEAALASTSVTVGGQEVAFRAATVPSCLRVSRRNEGGRERRVGFVAHERRADRAVYRSVTPVETRSCPLDEPTNPPPRTGRCPKAI